MQVTVSIKSWHYKYHTWLIGEKPDFKSLCPYFWTLLFIVLLTPLILFIKGIIYLVDKFYWSDTADKLGNFFEKPSMKKTTNFLSKLLLIIYVGIFLGIIGTGLYRLFMENSLADAFRYIGIFLGIIITIFLVLFGVIWFFTSDLVSSMWYAIKHRVCPMLKYKD